MRGSSFFRGRVYMELVVEILSAALESKQSKMAKPTKDIKPGKDGKSPASGTPATASTGAEEGKVAAEVLPVEPPPDVRKQYTKIYIVKLCN